MRIGDGNKCSRVDLLGFTPVETKKLTFSGEIDKIRNLGWGYFWTYYKWWTIALLTVLLSGGILIHDIVENKRPCAIAGAVYNCRIGGNTQDFAKKFAEYMKIDIKKEPIRIWADLDCGLQSPDAQVRQLMEMKLEAQVNSGDLDFIVGDGELMTALCRHSGNVSYLADLREVLPEELYREFADQFIWYESAEGEKIPAAIDVSEGSMDEALRFEEKPVYFGVLANARNTENAIGMFRYLLTENEAEKKQCTDILSMCRY